MDRLDRKILELLQNDASMRNVDLAQRVGLAPSSCLRRVKRLWREGVIKRAVLLTDAEKMGKNLRAIITVRLAEHSREAREDLVMALKQTSAVSQAYSVSGEDDMVVILALKNMEELRQIRDKLFENNKNITQYVTKFILEEIKFNPMY